MSENSCKLCGAALAGRAEAEGEFCCGGCARVHSVLAGLDPEAAATYFRAAQRLGIIPTEGDLPAPEPEPEIPVDPAAMRSERFSLRGQSCPSCAWVIEEVLRSHPGVAEAEASFFTDSALVRYDMRQTSPDQLDSLLGRLGYRLSKLEDSERISASRAVTYRFIGCAIITMNIMSLASLRYFEETGAVGSMPGWLPFLELALLVPVLWLGYLPVLARSGAALRRGAMTMDTLIALSVAAVLALSLAALTSGRDGLYFETCAGLITIALLGRMVEARMRDRSSAHVTQLMRLPIVRVRRIDGDSESYVATDAIGPGDLVGFAAGEVVPFDGVVDSDSALVSESVLTGEPEPIDKGVGDSITAGSTVIEGELRLRVSAAYAKTELKSIIDAVELALRRQESRMRSADRLAAWFTPAVVGVALAGWLVRMFVYGKGYAMSADGWFPSVSVMAVACPCAFSLAGVSAMTAAVAALLRSGVVVTDLAQLEDIHQLRRLVFDKTGTLTEGEMGVDELIWFAEPEPDLPAQLFAAEVGSRHPVARAICEHLLRERTAAREAGAEASDIPGGRELEVDGRRLRLGSQALFTSAALPAAARQHHTVVWFGYDGAAAGCFLLSDRIRKEARAILAALAASGCEADLVSGDRAEVATWVADQLGITRHRGGVSLEEKRTHIAELDRAVPGGVAYIGDGTNDALAMGEARVSIAVGRASDEALRASGIVLTSGDLRALPGLIDLGRFLHKVVRNNYLWALLFNAVFIPIALAGYLTPFTAMLLMLASSVIVLGNSLRLRRRSGA